MFCYSFIVNCLFLLETCLWRFFEACVEVEDFFFPCHFGAVPINDHLKLNFSFEVFQNTQVTGTKIHMKSNLWLITPRELL